MPPLIDLIPYPSGDGTTLEEIVANSRADIEASQEPNPPQILWEEDVVLTGGLPAVRMQIQSLGESANLLAVINGRGIHIVGFGDFSQFDAIASSLRSLE